MPCKEEEKNEVLNRPSGYSNALLLEGLTAGRAFLVGFAEAG